MESSQVHQEKCGGGSLHSEERKDPACVFSCRLKNEHSLYPPGQRYSFCRFLRTALGDTSLNDANLPSFANPV